MKTYCCIKKKIKNFKVCDVDRMLISGNKTERAEKCPPKTVNCFFNRVRRVRKYEKSCT